MLQDDFDVFFNGDEFAVEATLGGEPVKGIMRPGYDAAPIEGFGVAAGTSPTFALESRLVPAKPEGKAFVVLQGPGAATYKVGNARHDGTGLCVLDLLLNRNPKP